MVKLFLKLIMLFVLTCGVADAAIKNVAIVDVQKVVSKSPQVQALKREQELKQKELEHLIKKAASEIEKQTNSAQKQALVQKYDKQLKSKQESNAKTYAAKLQTVDKNINAIITKQANALGYDLVLTKGVVLVGGDDITDEILKVIK